MNMIGYELCSSAFPKLIHGTGWNDLLLPRSYQAIVDFFHGWETYKALVLCAWPGSLGMLLFFVLSRMVGHHVLPCSLLRSVRWSPLPGWIELLVVDDRKEQGLLINALGLCLCVITSF